MRRGGRDSGRAATDVSRPGRPAATGSRPGRPTGGRPAGGRPAAGRARNDLAQYDELAAQWWDPRGAFAMLHALARHRGSLVPAPAAAGGLLVDVGCGGGLLAPHLPPGYRHVGVDRTASALGVARAHGVVPVRADAARLPLPDRCADVVVVGELLEHVPDPAGVLGEALRVLRPGGTVVLDTIARTRRARLLAVTVAERLPGLAPRGIHDPALLVDLEALRGVARERGVDLALHGVRLAPVDYLRWLGRRVTELQVRRTRSTAVMVAGVGRAPHPRPARRPRPEEESP